ncbi:c-type cytochrome [Pseudooceanicola sp. 502str34]
MTATKPLSVLAALALMTAPALAGDAGAGEKDFRKCKACHSIEGAVKGGRTGPDLHGVIGRTAGTHDGFKYGPDLVAAGEKGLVWDEETIVAYVADPRGFLQEYLGDSGAKSKMTFKLPKGGEDIAAYLATFTE